MQEVPMLPPLVHSVFLMLLMKTNPTTKPILKVKEQALKQSKNRAAANETTAMLAIILEIMLCKVFLASIQYV